MARRVGGVMSARGVETALVGHMTVTVEFMRARTVKFMRARTVKPPVRSGVEAGGGHKMQRALPGLPCLRGGRDCPHRCTKICVERRNPAS